MRILLPFLLALLFYSCSTTKEGVIQIDTNPLKNVSRKVEKRKEYCSPLDKMMETKNCPKEKKKSK